MKHVAHRAQRGYLLLPVILILSLLATTAYLLSNDSALHNAGARSEADNSEARYTAEAGLNHALWQVQQANCSGYPSLSNQIFGNHSYSTSVSPGGGSPISLSASALLANGARYSISRTMVDTYELPLTQTLILGTDPGGDVMIDQFYKNQNYGRTAMQVSGNPAWLRRVLLQFDLSALPTGTRLLSAELQLYQTNTGSGLDALKAHAITRSWTEGTGTGTGSADGATWNTYNGVLPWTIPGGEYKATVAASAQTRVTAGWISWDISALAASWLNGTQTNQGVVLLSSGLESPQFASKEHPTATLRPRLVLTYACPCDAAGAGNSLTLQPDAASGQDTYLDDNDPVISWGAETSMRISNKLNSQKRGLLRFDLSAITSEAIITSATLTMNLEGIGSSNTGTLDLHRVTRDWNQSQANWINASSGNNWSSQGGDYDATPLASAGIDAAAPGTTQWDITTQVSDWVSGNSDNQGLMLKTSFDVNHADFSTSNHATPALRPTLVINYQCPCGAACAPPPPPPCDAFFAATAINGEFDTAGQAYRYNTGITPVPAGMSFNGISVPAGGGWVTVGGSGRLVLLNSSGTLINDSFTTGLSNLEGIAYIQSGDQAGKFVAVRGATMYLIDPTLSPASSYTTHSVAFASNLAGATYISGGSHDGHLALLDKVSSTLHIIDQAFNLHSSTALEKKPGAAQSYSPAFEGIAHLPDSDNFLIVDISLTAALFYSDLGTWLDGYPLSGFGISKPTAAAIDPLNCAHVIGSHPEDRYWSLTGGAGGAHHDVVLNPTADTRIQAGDTVNRGTESTLIVGMDNGSNRQSALLWFDAASLPAGAIIDSASLRLTAIQRTGNNNNWTLSVHRSGESWTETGATWFNRISGTAWSNGPGGTYDATAVTSTAAADTGAYTFNITPLVQEWVDGVSLNHGLQVVNNAPKKNWLTFESREGTSKPRITIRYSLP